MNTRTAVSVVIPVLLSPRFDPSELQRAIASVEKVLGRGGTISHEIVVVVNGTDPDAESQVLPLMSASTRIILSKPGAAAARNAGVAAALSPVTAFLDADDIWVHDYADMARLSALAANTVISGRATVISSGGHTIAVTSPAPSGRGPTLVAALRRQNSIVMSTVAGRTELFRRHPFDTSISYGEDWECWLRLAEAGVCFETFGDQPVIQYVNVTQETTPRSGPVSLRQERHVLLLHASRRPLTSWLDDIAARRRAYRLASRRPTHEEWVMLRSTPGGIDVALALVAAGRRGLRSLGVTARGR